MSGTSGGAICAALVWFAFEKNEDPIWGRLIRFWEDNTAQGWAEQLFNRLMVESLRISNSGLLPTFQISPASPFIQAISGVATVGHREIFRDFRALLKSHIDFDEIASWGPRLKRPILVIGAANVTTGKLTKSSPPKSRFASSTSSVLRGAEPFARSPDRAGCLLGRPVFRQSARQTS